MRELIDIFKEAGNLSPSELLKYKDRFDLFIDRIKNEKPFTLLNKDKTEVQVVIDPNEANRLVTMYSNGQFSNTIYVKTINGEQISLGSLAKTTDFGGHRPEFGADISTAGKSAIKLKPVDIGIANKGIPAKTLYNTIASSNLQSSDIGKDVISIATQIISNDDVIVPEGLANFKTMVSATRDDAGEYLGVLALIQDRSNFPNRQEFLKWLGNDLSEVTIFFPSETNHKLSDSEFINNKTGYKINVSSKGAGGGAAPSIGGLKIPDDMRKDSKFETVVKFIDICQKENAENQTFGVWELFKREIGLKYFDPIWQPFLNMNETQIEKFNDEFYDSRDYGNNMSKEWWPIIDSVQSRGGKRDASDAGKFLYAMRREIANIVNKKNAMPEFKPAILEILEMNFIQQYTDIQGNRFAFNTQWPAKINGEVTLVPGISATNPTSSKFSFKVGPAIVKESNILKGIRKYNA